MKNRIEIEIYVTNSELYASAALWAKKAGYHFDYIPTVTIRGGGVIPYERHDSHTALRLWSTMLDAEVEDAVQVIADDLVNAPIPLEAWSARVTDVPLGNNTITKQRALFVSIANGRVTAPTTYIDISDVHGILYDHWPIVVNEGAEQDEAYWEYDLVTQHLAQQDVRQWFTDNGENLPSAIGLGDVAFDYEIDSTYTILGYDIIGKLVNRSIEHERKAALV